MANEQGAAVVEEGLTAAQKAEQEAFAAEMATHEGVETDAVAPVTAEVVVTDDVNPEPEVVVDPVVERKEVIKGFTEEEIRAALEELPKLRKSIDTTAGTFGSRLAEQQQLIETMKAQKQAVGNLSPDKLTRLSKEYPELAEILASDLNEYIGKGGQDAPVIDQAPIIEGIVTKRLADQEVALERKLELKALAKRHGDWKETASFQVDPASQAITWNNPKFGEWVQKQAPEVRNKLISVWDADYVTEQLDKFKDAIKPKPVNKDLDDAVLPRGTRRVQAKADENDEDAAFKAEMARR
jgi:hypothetical protein